MAQRHEYQDIDGHVILLFVHPAAFGDSLEYSSLPQSPETYESITSANFILHTFSAKVHEFWQKQLNRPC